MTPTRARSELDLLLDAAGLAVSAVDESGRVTACNGAASALLGYDDVGIVGRDAAELVAEEHHELLRSLLDHVSTGGSWSGRLTVRRADGETRPVSVVVRPLRDAGGEVVGAVGVGWDVSGELGADARFGTLLVEDMTERKQMERELRESEKELRELAARLSSAREEEQARVARELHDDVGQRLTALKLDLAWLGRKMAEPTNAERGSLPSDVGERVEGMIALVDDTIRSMRGLLTDLRPMILDDLGLEAAIEWHVTRFTERTGLRCHLSVSLPPHERRAERDSACFRILQEGLTNVARHAQAQRVWVTVARDPDLCLEIRDDGVGISDVALSRPAMGIVGMRERARALGGSVDIRRHSPCGTSIHARLPW